MTVLSDGDTPTKKMEMVSKIFLKKIDIGQTGHILEEVEKANCFTEEEVAGFRKLRKISRF